MSTAMSKLRVFAKKYRESIGSSSKASPAGDGKAASSAKPESPGKAAGDGKVVSGAKAAGHVKAVNETAVSKGPSAEAITLGQAQKLPTDMVEFVPTKGVEDIEVLAPAAGWEASFDVGKKTHKVGSDDKAEKIEIGAEYALGQLPLPPINFTVRGIPCFAAGGVEVKIGTSASAGSGQQSAKAYAIVAGKVTINVGKAKLKEYEVGIGGGGEASFSLEVAAAETAEQLNVDTTIPLKLAVFVSVRAKLDLADETYGPEVKKTLAQWTLGTIKINWTKGSGSANLGSNPDVAALVAIFEQAILAACNQAAGAVEDAVDKYAPQAVKDGAVDAVKWAAESEGGGQVADLVEEVAPKEYKDGAESVIKAVGGGDWDTSAEATDRVNEENRKFEDCRDDLHTCMAASGLNGELRPFRSAEEYNKIIDVWQAESENIAKGKEAPGAWRGMIDDLVKTARTRQKQQKAEEAAKEKKKKDDESAALQAEIDKAVQFMEAARTGAIGQGNVLNNRLKASPNANAQKFLDKAWPEFNWAETARKGVQGAQGQVKIQQAYGAAAAYAKAKETYTNGIHQL